MQSHRFSLSGTAIKRIALLSMLLDHIGASLLEAGVFVRSAAPGTALLRLDLCLRWAGRLAFPLYCFLLVEGFLHTHSLRHYAGRMLLFALVSEVPFDLAFFRTAAYWDHQNVYWTLFFGLLALWCLRRFGEHSAPGMAGFLLCALAAELLRTDYGALGVVLIAGLYLCRARRTAQCCWGALATSYELPAPLAMLFVFAYNGQPGRCSRQERWGYYLFYPLHLLLLAALTNGLF